MFHGETIDASVLRAGFSLLDGLPFPALWILSDYEIAWCNAAARATYGIVTAEPDVDITVALQCADKALYRAKAAGRDRVVSTNTADELVDP